MCSEKQVMFLKWQIIGKFISCLKPNFVSYILEYNLISCYYVAAGYYFGIKYRTSLLEYMNKTHF